MVNGDRMRELQSQLQSAFFDYELSMFEQTWNLSNNVIHDVPVRSFYLTVEPGYGNLAILTSDFLVDIEGDDENPPGNLSVQRLSAISGVEFYWGPVEDIPESEEAKLVVLAYVAGSEVVDLHWIAYTDDDRHHLMDFGKALIDSIKES